METLTQKLTEKEAARQLRVTPATLKNWLKTGQLSSLEQKEVKKLTGKLHKGLNERLGKRANKKFSKKQFIPLELLKNDKSRYQLILIQEQYALSRLGINAAMYGITSVWLEGRNRSVRTSPHIVRVMQEWKKEIHEGQTDPSFNKLKLPDEKDCLGIIYQCLMNEGNKSGSGAYYTPENLVESLMQTSGIPGNIEKICLEPGCGSGRFLMKLSEKRGSYKNIIGIEKDKIAARLSVINLVDQYPEEREAPAVICADFLRLTSKSTIRADLVIGNPPWGAVYDSKLLGCREDLSGITNCREISLFFILASLHCLKTGGEIRFLLPEALFLTKTYNSFRQYLLTNHLISRIEEIRDLFHRVQSQVRALYLQKESETISYKTGRGREITVNPGYFLKNWHSQIHIHDNSLTPLILEKMEKKGLCILEKNCTWFMGIVSGNNRESLIKSPAGGEHPVLLGRNVHPGRQPEPDHWLNMSRDFQQAPDLQLYNNSKIVYRFISNRPVCAVDRRGYICLNSANCFIPENPQDMDRICLLLNDPCFSFYFKHKFNSVKTLQSHLKNIPFPDLSLADNPLPITDHLMDYYGLEENEKKLILREK